MTVGIEKNECCVFFVEVGHQKTIVTKTLDSKLNSNLSGDPVRPMATDTNPGL